MKKVIDLKKIFGDTAKLAEVNSYAEQAISEAGTGNDVVLTGAAPVWLYLYIAHALHGKARSLSYDSPVTGEVTIFNHNPY